MTYKMFNGKRYEAFGEYWSKPQAEKKKGAMKAEGYLCRIVPGAYLGSHTLYVRKK